tara:strand:+ start:72 stop:812 length:741 start_codon:yes stop_codon:yes gene_type:complete
VTDLRLGDCLEVMKSIPDGSVDAIITDPPYGTTACKWDSVIDFDLMWEQLNRIIKPNGAIVLFGSEPFSSALRMSNIKNYKYDWIWKKNKSTGFLNSKKQPLRSTENIHVFYKKQCTYHPQKTKGHKPVNSFTKNTSDGETMGKTKKGLTGGGQTDRFPTNVIEVKVINNDDKNKTHPTQKPVALMEYLIKTYTNENETVLDFTMGSGSTGVAAKNLNRNFIGIEQDEKYFKIAEERIKETEYKLF